MEAKHPEITLAEILCEKLRQIYYPDLPWIECHRDVSMKLAQLKSVAKKFYCDKSEREILMELVKYSSQDLKDALT